MAQAFGGVVLFEELPTMITHPSLIFAAANTNQMDFGAVPYAFKGREGVSWLIFLPCPGNITAAHLMVTSKLCASPVNEAMSQSPKWQLLVYLASLVTYKNNATNPPKK